MPLGLAALDDLFSAFEELQVALDGTDVATIDAAASQVSHCASAVRSIGVWRADDAIRERVTALLPLIEAARVRINILSDHAGQRLALLAAHGSTQAPLVYGR